MSDTLTISETQENKEYWLQQGLGIGIEDLILGADALIVPEHNFRQDVEFAFHQDTIALYRYLSCHFADSISVEICATDEEYLEITLHSQSHRFSKIVVGYIAAPILLGLLTNYLYDQIKAEPTDIVEATIVVEDHECRSFKFSFNGEAKDFALLADQVGELSRQCIAAQR